LGNWLIPWKERGRSASVRDNLLWNHERLYVMDNHRLALWCWWQHLDECEQWDYLHIDRHYDAIWQEFNPWPANTTAEHRQDLNSFRNAVVREGREGLQLYRWDTITSALWSLHSSSVQDVVFATADEGDQPAIPRMQQISPWDLPGYLSHFVAADYSPARSGIVDVDIDYFTRHDLDGAFGQVFSDEYIREIGRHLYTGLSNGRVGVATIALSPETTGSWTLAERVLSILLSPFNEFSEFPMGAPDR
jgi:hypothetical protein